jgi:TfoX/Sxy family transcriptional regulator of competence genes
MTKKTSKIQVLQTKAWDTPEELDQWQRGVAKWLNEIRSKKTSKKTSKTK